MTGYSGTGSRKGRTPLRPGLTATALLLDSTLFGHEKPDVYQESLAFAACLEPILQKLPKMIAVRDHSGCRRRKGD
jgi:hypothetical protein